MKRTELIKCMKDIREVSTKQEPFILEAFSPKKKKHH